MKYDNLRAALLVPVHPLPTWQEADTARSMTEAGVSGGSGRDFVRGAVGGAVGQAETAAKVPGVTPGLLANFHARVRDTILRDGWYPSRPESRELSEWGQRYLAEWLVNLVRRIK